MAEKLTFPAFTTPDYATVLADLNRLPEKASRNLKNAFGIITERAANTMGVSRANIWLFTDANRTTLRCIDLYDYATRTHSDNGTLVGEQFPNYIQALKSERVIIADDAAHDPRTREFAAQYLPAHNICSMLDAPIRQDGEVVGVVCLEQTDDIRHWSEDEANFVATLSDFATIALLSHHKDIAETALIQAQKMESLGRLAGGIAHDFNNILTVITGAVDTLQVKWDVQKDQQRLLELIAEASERARKVTRNLLAFGGQQNLTLETFATRSLLDAVNDLTSSIIREDIQITFENTDKNYWINGDQTQLEQVLLNLMINSIDAMPQGGAITVEVLPPDHNMQIGFAVTDTGSGISERIKDKIFEPFFTTKGAFGSGLGLSISLGIMQQHSGSLRCVQSGPLGSRFEIRLPQVEDPEQQSQSSAQEEPPEQPTPALKILLVEDEPSVRDIVTQMLTVIGYDILVAQDPEDALALLQDNTVGLLISDVVMPGMRGPDLYEEARKHMPTLPALFVSGYSEEIVADLPGEPSQVGYLSKPFTLKQLRGAIDELVARSA